MIGINYKISKRELTFLTIGILMLIMVGGLLIFSINFLIGNINQSLNKNSPGLSNIVLKFQIEKAEQVLNQK